MDSLVDDDRVVDYINSYLKSLVVMEWCRDQDELIIDYQQEPPTGGAVGPPSCST